MDEVMHKMALIGAGKKHYQKLLNKKQNKVDEWSEKLKEAHDSDTSVRRRANLRIKLQDACTERDRLEQTLKIAEEWKKELKKEL